MSADAAELDPPIVDPSLSLLGEVIGGRYLVTGVIGQGGMGVVYGATHLELEQPVAIKVLPAMYARDAETLKRFEQEAKTASRVKHPNVVQVFDLGRLASGEPYLAMELLDGTDLEALLVEGQPLTHARILEILAPMGAALDALHRENVVHRDVKPSNVFFSRNSSGHETVKLVDFGLATLTAAGEGAERLTRVGHVVGTAVYMPPESARGALCDPAGDVYSLAVMAFELLVGAPPFDGQPMAVLLDKVTHRAPTLSSVAGRPFGRELEALFASALDREPERRPRTATEFVDRLRRALAREDEAGAMPPSAPAAPRRGEQSSVRPTSGELTRAGADERGGRRAWIAAAVVLLLALSSGAWLMTRAPDVRPVPLAPLPAAPTQPAEAAVDLDVPEPTVVAAAEPTPIVESAPVTTPTRAPRPRAVVSTSAPPTPTSAPTRVEEGPTADARTHEATEPAAPRPEASPESTDRTGSLVQEAARAMLHGEIPRARELYREATLASPRSPGAWRGLGLASERLRLVPEARTAYERYLELAPEAADAATVRDRLARLGG